MNEFEPILLKKLIFNSQFYGKTMPIIQKEFFSVIGNQELFALIHAYYAEYKQIPTLTELVAKVKNVSNAEIRTEIISALNIVNSTAEVENIEFMLDETVSWVKDAMYLDALQIGSDGLMKKDDVLKLKAQAIMDARSKVSIDSDLGLDFDDFETMLEYYTNRMLGIRTQHTELNKRLGPGFLPGTLSVILAAAGIGKSLLMTDLISGMIKENKNILLVSLEMADKEIMKRVHANAMDLPINSLLDLSKTAGELKQLKRPVLSKDEVQSAYNKLKISGSCGKLFIKDYPSGSLSPLMLEQLVESYKIEKNVEFDIVYVDYLGIMKSDLVTPAAGLYSYIKSIGEELRSTAKKLKLPIISASQLNRGAVNNTQDADNSNVSDSIGTVMTSDFMIFLLQNEEMKEMKEIVCKVTKNRFNGRTDTWIMNIDYEKMRFNDLLVQGSSDAQGAGFLDITNTAPKATFEDFGITPEKQAEKQAEKQEKAEDFAKSEIKDIVLEDIEKLQRADKTAGSTNDPFTTDLDELYASLDI